MEESEPSRPHIHIKRFQAMTLKRLTYEEKSPKAKDHDESGGMQLVVVEGAHTRSQPRVSKLVLSKVRTPC